MNGNVSVRYFSTGSNPHFSFFFAFFWVRFNHRHKVNRLAAFQTGTSCCWPKNKIRTNFQQGFKEKIT